MVYLYNFLKQIPNLKLLKNKNLYLTLNKMEENSIATQFEVLKNKDDITMFKRFLKEHKYDFDEVNIDGKTLIMLLIESESPTEFIWFCLEYFADPNIQDHEGNTALHYAFLKNNKNYIYALLLFNADLEIRNKEEVPDEEIQGKTCYEKVNLFKEDELEKLKLLFNDKIKLTFANLTRHRRDALREVYNFLDDMKTGVTEEKLFMFNVWLNEDSHEVAKEDAKLFFSIARIGGSSVSEIYFEEWMIAMTRIAKFHGMDKIDEFINLFDKAQKSGRKLEDAFG
jgi:hypothetical protein